MIQWLTWNQKCTNGGKIICLQSTLPNAGMGALKPREDVKMLGTAKVNLPQWQCTFLYPNMVL